MEMSNQEIVRNWNESKNRKKQIGILADLNECTKQNIIDILKAGGVYPRKLPRNRKSNKPKQSDLHLNPVNPEPELDKEAQPDDTDILREKEAALDFIRKIAYKRELLKKELCETSKAWTQLLKMR